MAATLSSPSLLNCPNRMQASFSPNPKLIQSSPSLTVAFSSQKLANPPSLRANRRLGAGGPDRARRHLVVTNAVRKLGESEEIPLAVSGEIVVGQVPSQSGIYAVYDKEGTLQFIGISRNISASVSTHLKTVPQLCNSLKVGIVEEQDRTSLVDAWKSWMEEHLAVAGNVPPGNESGNNTWVRQPPKAKPDLRLTPRRGKELTVPLEELIDKLVKEIAVVAFIKGSRNAPQCGFSQRVIGILNSHGVEYECVNVLDEEYNFGLRETLKKYSNWPTFPQIFVKGELLGGADILTSMAEKGELSALFKK